MIILVYGFDGGQVTVTKVKLFVNSIFYENIIILTRKVLGQYNLTCSITLEKINGL